ncbi:hypothetical protein TNCV_2158871 [Trichonephila clavipes]|nr:hypothetical protein TNCV_2158871 [Trichonephila clavipes]
MIKALKKPRSSTFVQRMTSAIVGPFLLASSDRHIASTQKSKAILRFVQPGSFNLIKQPLLIISLTSAPNVHEPLGDMTAIGLVDGIREAWLRLDGEFRKVFDLAESLVTAL